jgi:hypothetical protein
MKSRITGEAIGGWATAAALLVTIITFAYTYHAQEEFNRAQLKLQNTAAELQKEANQEQRKAAEAQRETAAVEALGRYLEKPTSAIAWETAETIIDVMGQSADSAWKTTAKRAIYRHPETLKTIECELYSEAFKDFVVSLTVTWSRTDLCAGKAQLKPIPIGVKGVIAP